MTPKPLYAELACLLTACANCIASGNDEWLERHRERVHKLVRDRMPSGSGLDVGCKLDVESTADKLMFNCSFHHMSEHGYYDGWTDHTVIVTPSLASGFDLRITGRDRQDIKDYLAQIFDHALREPVPEEGQADGP